DPYAPQRHAGSQPGAHAVARSQGAGDPGPGRPPGGFREAGGRREEGRGYHFRHARALPVSETKTKTSKKKKPQAASGLSATSDATGMRLLSATKSRKGEMRYRYAGSMIDARRSLWLTEGQRVLVAQWRVLLFQVAPAQKTALSIPQWAGVAA